MTKPSLHSVPDKALVTSDLGTPYPRVSPTETSEPTWVRARRADKPPGLLKRILSAFRRPVTLPAIDEEKVAQAALREDIAKRWKERPTIGGFIQGTEPLSVVDSRKVLLALAESGATVSYETRTTPDEAMHFITAVVKL